MPKISLKNRNAQEITIFSEKWQILEKILLGI